MKYNKPTQIPIEPEELQLNYQNWNKELLQKLKDIFDKGESSSSTRLRNGSSGSSTGTRW